MATRSIVTSQPDVACDVCDRRLLRGEQPDVFLAAGRRRTVCELCAPRAVHEGWLRETERQPAGLPELRPRRGRSFLERLRQVGTPRVTGSPAEQEIGGLDAGEGAAAPSAETHGAPAPEDELQPYDFLDSDRVNGGPRASSPRTGQHAGGLEGERSPSTAASSPPTELEQAIAVFNAGEFPRRIAGVARSLGAPEVNVRTAEHARSVIVIVVAWELCWYRYAVDLDERELGARLLVQGTELTELEHEDRVVNALAADSGALSLTVF